MRDTAAPRGPGARRALAALAAGLVLGAGCAVGGDDPAIVPPATGPERVGGVAAEVVPDSPPTQSTTTKGSAPTLATPPTTAAIAGSPTTADAATATATATPGATAPASLRTVLSLPDARGDAGPTVPGHGDLVEVRVDTTTTEAVVLVTFAGPLPATLAPRETVGVGVDVYEPKARESTHQVFVEGGADGWYAYLFDGRRQVPYPGSIRLRGAAIELRLPLSRYGGSGAAELDAFCDWSRGDSLLDGADRAPATGRTAFTW